MTKKKLREMLIESQLSSFKEFIELSCKEIAMCCRATSDVVGNRFDVKAYVAESARRWFDMVEALSDAEFLFMAQKDLFKHITEENADEDIAESDDH